MGFIALILTLLLEQLRPLPARNAIGTLIESISEATERNMNAGRRRHGMYAWFALVVGAALLTGALYAIAVWLSWLLALAFDVLVLYMTLGFRQFSHHFTEIQAALAAGDLATARRTLTAWKAFDAPEFDATALDTDEIVRQSLEYGLQLSQRHVFGVFFWFLLLPGPMGPVLYRAADYVARHWNRPPVNRSLPQDRFGEYARLAFAWLDWLPARLTAIGFAIVGDFEGAIYCWRRLARSDRTEPAGLPHPDSRLLLLASASGALGTRLLTASEIVHLFGDRDEHGAGLAEPQVVSLAAGAAMMWRAVVLWLVLLLLLSLAGWLG